MKSARCNLCGFIDWSEAVACKRCGAEFAFTEERSLNKLITSSSSANGHPVFIIYAGAVSASFFVCLSFIVIKFIAVFIQPKPLEGAMHVSLYLLLWLTYAFLARAFGCVAQTKAIPLGFCLLAFYLLLTAWEVVSLVQYNQKYGGWFWVNKFFFSPVVLYLLPAVLTFIGTHFGSRRTGTWAILIVVSISIGLVAVWRSQPRPTPERRANYSLNVVGGNSNEIELKLDLRYSLQMIDRPLEFRAYGGATDNTSLQKLTVVRHTPEFHPTTKMLINADGKNIEIMMWPINQPDGSSRLEFKGNEDYSQISNWGISLNTELAGALFRAQHVEIDWGNFHASLSEAQLASVQSFIRSWAKVLAEEGAVCTNPMCVQPLRSSAK